jgi:hypothetical protein
MKWFRSKKNRSKKNTTTIVDSDIAVVLSPDRAPEFKRVYTAPINSNIVMFITTNSWGFSSRSNFPPTYNGELKQSDGRSVTFDPLAPAKNILDKTILSVVLEKLEIILDEDKKFRNQLPNTFTDVKGKVWVALQQ